VWGLDPSIEPFQELQALKGDTIILVGIGMILLCKNRPMYSLASKGKMAKLMFIGEGSSPDLGDHRG
jgi:hypothetical protein